MAVAAAPDPLLQSLRRHFGHDGFREGQREVVEAILAGNDVILVMPTGGGKSLCYQLPALLEREPTIVISPLIALMKDQIDVLQARGVAAAALHSNVPLSTQRAVENAYRSNALRLLYVAPERLVRPDFRSMLAATRPRRIVVDEAHCISEWGHDFRRDYLRIGEVAAELAPIPMQLVACTATATPEVRVDIAARLGQRQPENFVSGFSRPNLHLAVERLRSEADKLARLEQVIDQGDGQVIVYAGTRSRAAAIAERLGRRMPTMLYHAELSAEGRIGAQERFRSGLVRVAVTTSAFGMGIDIPSVRQVVHTALPASLEEYYQQAGRAGRDGLPATCLVLYTAADRRLPEFFIETANPEPATIAGVYRSLLAMSGDPGAWSLVARRDAAVRDLRDAAGDAARKLLRDAGVVDDQGAVAAYDLRQLPVDHRRIATHRRLAYRRLESFLGYLTGHACRHRVITEHFGEVGTDASCGTGCDNCAGHSAPLTGVTRPAERIDDTSIRKALSAVARLHGRVGLVRLAGVLTGSRSRSVAAVPGGTDIPTYGALSHWREADVVELLRRLLDAGALSQGAPPYPTVDLTPLGVETLRGARSIEIDDPRSLTAPGRGGSGSSSGVASQPPMSAPEKERFERLRTWRTGHSRARDIPAYVVFPDRTLVELAVRAPRSLAEIAQTPGVGPTKLALYGAELLDLLAADRRAPSPAPAADHAS
jgi:ATP-dependent DNA helicase RecQ